ncbi:MAG: T9SS type A sorting domain-containing protein [Flavobacteriales bacterium]|jgi:hypothetical protein
MNKMIVFILVLCSTYSNAQFATLAGGGEGSGPGGTVSFSVGQLVVESTEDSEGSISPGVQQTYESNEVYINEVYLHTVKVFPNPTTHLIQLTFDKPFNGTLKVYDMNARIVLEQRVNEITKIIDVQSWSAGTYLIFLADEKSIFSIHQIIKNN